MNENIEAANALIDELLANVKSLDELRELYAENELDNDRNPTEAGFQEWLDNRLNPRHVHTVHCSSLTCYERYVELEGPDGNVMTFEQWIKPTI
jgi:hypothetical protein